MVIMLQICLVHLFITTCDYLWKEERLGDHKDNNLWRVDVLEVESLEA